MLYFYRGVDGSPNYTVYSTNFIPTPDGYECPDPVLPLFPLGTLMGLIVPLDGTFTNAAHLTADKAFPLGSSYRGIAANSGKTNSQTLHTTISRLSSLKEQTIRHFMRCQVIITHECRFVRTC